MLLRVDRTGSRVVERDASRSPPSGCRPGARQLREVEVLCQTMEDQKVPFLQDVLDILYKTDDADEFVAPDESEALGVQ